MKGTLKISPADVADTAAEALKLLGRTRDLRFVGLHVQDAVAVEGFPLWLERNASVVRRVFEAGLVHECEYVLSHGRFEAGFAATLIVEAFFVSTFGKFLAQTQRVESRKSWLLGRGRGVTVQLQTGGPR